MKNRALKPESIQPPSHSGFAAKDFLAKTPLKIGMMEIACLASISVGVTVWFLAKPTSHTDVYRSMPAAVQVIPSKAPSILKVDPPPVEKLEPPIIAKVEIPKTVPSDEKKPETENWSIGEVDPEATALLKSNSAKYAELLAQEKLIMETANAKKPQRTFVTYAPEPDYGNASTATSANGSSASSAARSPSSTVHVGALGSAKLGETQWFRYPINTIPAAQAIISSPAFASVPAPVMASAPVIARQQNGCSIKPPAIFDPSCRASYPCKVCGGCCCLCEAMRAHLT